MRHIEVRAAVAVVAALACATGGAVGTAGAEPALMSADPIGGPVAQSSQPEGARAAVPASAKEAGTGSSRPASYFPHWVTREGAITPSIMSRLPAGTIIGTHHGTSQGDLKRILDFPNKRFRIAWYAESNVAETDDPTPVGTPVKTRVREARQKQTTLAGAYGSGRFANLVELDGSRDKKDGNLKGTGNARGDWLADAQAVKSAGFRLIAKSPAPSHVAELRSKLGRDFVPRIVFEDVTGSAGDDNPGYRSDARTLAARGETMTLVIHEGAYGGFPGTSIGKARMMIAADFSGRQIEAFWGRATSDAGFEHIKVFTAGQAAKAKAG